MLVEAQDPSSSPNQPDVQSLRAAALPLSTTPSHHKHLHQL